MGWPWTPSVTGALVSASSVCPCLAPEALTCLSVHLLFFLLLLPVLGP